MKTMRLIVATSLLVLPILVGCSEPPPPKRASFLHDNPWVVKAPTTEGPGQPRPARTPETPKPSPPEYKPDTEVVHPIFEANGKWTVRVAFYNPNPEKRLTALHYANDHCGALRKKGYEAYVTDFIAKAIVSIGSFNDDRDPKLIEIWREAYNDWLKLRGGRKSPLREEMERFYGEKTVFGDQPMPVSIIDLQVKMKAAYRIPVTAEEKKRHEAYLKERVRTGENP